MAAAAASPAEFFPQIKPVVFNPDAPASELLVFRHYNAEVHLSFVLFFCFFMRALQLLLFEDVLYFNRRLCWERLCTTGVVLLYATGTRFATLVR
jgi:hypothetical protein